MSRRPLGMGINITARIVTTATPIMASLSESLLTRCHRWFALPAVDSIVFLKPP
jgi:hypothetical protein